MIGLFIIIALTTVFFGYFSKIVGEKLNLIDVPETSKIHNEPVPMTGGLVLFLSIIITSFYKFSYLDTNYFVFLTYLTSFFIIGFIDDKINLNDYIRLFLIIIISLFFIINYDFFVIEKIYFVDLNSEFYFGRLKIFITLLCILLMYVAVNMADGINGLIILISIFSILVLKLLILNQNLNLIDTSIFISLVILFFFNIKNKLFLGNSGTSLLSAYFIFLTIEPNYFYKMDVFKVVSIFMIIGIDMVRLIFLRIRKKRSPFMRDHNHFHYILLNKFDLTTTNLIYLSLSFSPIVLSSLLNISVLFFILFSIFIYFVILLKIDK